MKNASLLAKAALIPLKEALSTQQRHIDVLLKIDPQLPPVTSERPSFNLGFVIDRSGSMSGDRLKQVKKAVSYAIELLEERDVISVVDYGGDVNITLLATPVVSKKQLQDAVEGIRCHGNTALYGGWLEGATQVANGLDPQRINRVILLSDGLANAGLTDPAQISQIVAGMAEKGVSTTTMGIGRSYNEELMASMADAGRGNYHYIGGAEQIPAIFRKELFDLETTVGQTVRLQDPDGCLQPAYGLQEDQEGYVLPDLVGGVPAYFLFRLNVARNSKASVHLQYQTPEGIVNLPLLLELPRVDQATWDAMDAHPEVAAELARFEATRLRTEASIYIKQQRRSEALELLNQAYRLFDSFPMLREEQRDIARSIEELRDDPEASIKRLSKQIFSSGKGDRRTN